MDNKLREALSDMSDEDFFELRRNIEISCDLRDLQKGELGFSEEQIMRKLDVTRFDLLYIFNGAFEFTVRHMAIIDVMKEEYDFFNDGVEADEVEVDDKEEEVDIADRDMPDSMNYNKNDDKGDVIYLGGSRELTTEEEIELEMQDEHDVMDVDSKEGIETMEQLSARIYKEHQEKLKHQNKPQENTDTSIVNFN